jgi:hypothetical protein
LATRQRGWTNFGSSTSLLLTSTASPTLRSSLTFSHRSGMSLGCVT